MMRGAILLAIALGTPAAARLTPADLGAAGVTPPPDARLPRGLRFVDQAGRAVKLGSAAVPTILLFADYSCAHLCGPGVTLTAGALHDAGLLPGRDYGMIVIGLDGDGPAAARRLRDTRLRDLPREAVAMRLLTGTPATIAAAEEALGYHAVYDAEADQFAHDAAIYVLAPDDTLSAVLPETATIPARMRGAVVAAGQGARYRTVAAAPLSGLVALCYGLAAAHGIYGQAIVAVLRLSALLILGGLALLLGRAVRRRRQEAGG